MPPAISPAPPEASDEAITGKAGQSLSKGKEFMDDQGSEPDAIHWLEVGLSGIDTIHWMACMSSDERDRLTGSSSEDW
jgi:hypothetical protein